MKASANYSLKPVKLHTQVVDGNTQYSLVTGDIARLNASDKIDVLTHTNVTYLT